MTFVLGIVSGLVTACLLFAIRQGIVKVFEPWFEDRTYHDTKIEGRWKARATIDGQEVERDWEITRHGHDVSAKIKSTSGFDKDQEFNMTGTFKDLILTGTYVRNDPARVDRGTYTLRLIGDGQKFVGKVARYSPQSERVEADKYELFDHHQH